MRFVTLAVTAAFFTAACGGPKEEPKPEVTADTVPPTPTISASPDSAPAKKADSASARKAAAPARDSAFGPKFTIDEKTGKVTPIKKTP